MSNRTDQQAEGKTLLEAVEHADGKPIVISRFGYRIVAWGDKKYVVAATPHELAEQIALHEKRPVSEVLAEVNRRMDVPACGGVGPFQCFGYNGCTKCRAVYIGNGYYDCVCVGTD